MLSKSLLSSFLLLCISPVFTQASNILFFHLIATSSHRTSIWPLATELANRGHHVTYIFPAENRDGDHPNITDINPSKMGPILEKFVGQFDVNIKLNNTVDTWILTMFSKSVELCEAFYDSPEVTEWLSKPNLKYDLVMVDITFGECVYGLVHRFQAKHIVFAPVMPTWIWDGFGFLPESSSIPEPYFYRDPAAMGFTSRMLTTISYLVFRAAYVTAFVNPVEPIIRQKLNSHEMPSLLEFERNTSLVLYNGYFVEEYPMSMPPLMVSYSGLWCSQKYVIEGQPALPKEIAQFIGKSRKGFVYVSFGSSAMVSKMPESVLAKFFDTFSAFPDIQFLWRWKGPEPKNKPKNVLLKEWFPQRDILAQKNILGFVMQAGRPSSQEAFCYGVPMITFPMFGDQNVNAGRLKYLGISITLDFTTFTTTEFKAAIRDLIDDPAYKVRMNELSAMFRDRLIDPLENALYWTEYVIRYNTTLLKPLAITQSWWQRRLLDVYAVLVLVILLIAGVLLALTKLILKAIFRLIFPQKLKIKVKVK